MFAIIQNGGKQYKVQPGMKLHLEKIDLAAGNEFEIGEVLVFNDDKNTLIGNPLVDGVSVKCVILEQKREKKVLIFKKRRRKNSRRKTGHRQRITLVEVKEIKK